MLQVILKYLKQPFPFFRKKWLVVAITTFWVLVIALIVSPVGLNMVDAGTVYHLILYFTMAAAFASSLVTYLFPLLFRNHHDPQSWTRGKFLLFCLAITTIMWGFTVYANHYVKKIIGYESIFSDSIGSLLLFIPCLIVGMFPTISIYFLEKQWQKHEHNSLENAMEKEMITFSNNGKGYLSFPSTDFLYAEVIKNDLTFYFRNEQEHIETKTIRMTLLQALDVFDAYPNILRIHRAFIVNIHKISEVSGNSHGYKLTLKNVNQQLPLSKTYAKMVLEKISSGRLC